jgi:hypothetical protein
MLKNHSNISQYQLPFSTSRWQHVSQKCLLLLLFSKKSQIADNSTTTEARVKNKEIFEILKFYKFSLNYKTINNQISHQFLVTI